MKARLILAALALVTGIEGAIVKGVVRDEQNHALSAVEVHLEPGGIHHPLIVRTDPAGHYLFDNVEPGAYTLHADVAGKGNAGAGPFVLHKGEAKTIDLQLQTAQATAQFFDEPTFTVAGVTDNTYRGGHGSDTMLRSKEKLAEAAAALSKDSKAKEGSTESDRPVALVQARALMKSGDYAQARTLLLELVKGSNDAAAHHLIAQCDEQLSNPLEAVREYQRAVELSPEDAYISDWAMELLVHGTPQPAVEVFSKGIALYPKSLGLRLGLCSALYAQGNDQQAARCFFEVSDRSPNDSQPYLFLGELQSKEVTDSDEYLLHMARFAELQPQNAWANYLYGVALAKHEQGSERADRDAKIQHLFEKAVSIDPKLAAAHLQLGALFEGQGDPEAAASEYEAAAKADPALPEAHYRLAQCYGRLGKKQEGQRELAAYQQLSKTQADELERKRNRLKRFVVLLRDNKIP